jgi:2-dehydro-3-deoxygluconokinase
MKKICCFGELLLRMSPVLGQWPMDPAMPVYLGGSELNVASALASWGVPVSYFTALPDTYLSQEICAVLRLHHIDTSAIHFSGSRIGLYILPQGADLKHASVIYDREHSSFSQLETGTIDWERVFDGVGWFHFSAISAALTANAASLCLEAIQAAEKMRLTISVDLNYRSRLWQYGKRPHDIMPNLVSHCDLVMGNIWSAHALLGTTIDDQIHQKGNRRDYLAHARVTALEIQERFPRCSTVAHTFRFDQHPSGLLYYASLWHQSKQYDSLDFTSPTIQDKVGTGDCFMAGLIYGQVNAMDPSPWINFAASAAFGKFFEPGDRTSQDPITILNRISKYG